MTANGPEDTASTDLGCVHPTIDRFLDPDGHGNSPDVAALADQVDNGPMSLPDLQVFHFQGG